MKSKQLIIVFAGLGVFAGIGYWIYLYYSDPENAPSVTDLFQVIQSYFRRGKSQVTSIIENTGIGGDSSGGDYIGMAMDIIAPLETFSPRPYNDQGHQAIGYGHDFIPGDGFSSDSVISESDAWQLLRQDIETRYAPALSSVQVDLSDNQKAALISFIYNVGVGAFQSSTMLRLLNQGDYDGAAAEFDRWNKAGGKVNASLVARRNLEESLFQS